MGHVTHLLPYRVFPCGSCFNATTRIGISLMEVSSLIANPTVCENKQSKFLESQIVDSNSLKHIQKNASLFYTLVTETRKDTHTMPLHSRHLQEKLLTSVLHITLSTRIVHMYSGVSFTLFTAL